MARHVIEIPIIKSSNDDHVLVGDYTHFQPITVPRVSELLYIGQNSNIGHIVTGKQIGRAHV